MHASEDGLISAATDGVRPYGNAGARHAPERYTMKSTWDNVRGRNSGRADTTMGSDNGWCWVKRPGGAAGALAAAAALAVFLVACSNDASGPRNSQPDINLLSPAEVAQGRGALTLIVHGTDFVRGSVVRVNGRSRETEFVSDMELRAELPAADFTAAGTAQIIVHNPAPGGGSSSVAGLAITAGLVVGTPEITVLP